MKQMWAIYICQEYAEKATKDQRKQLGKPKSKVMYSSINLWQHKSIMGEKRSFIWAVLYATREVIAYVHVGLQFIEIVILCILEKFAWSSHKSEVLYYGWIVIYVIYINIIFHINPITKYNFKNLWNGLRDILNFIALILFFSPYKYDSVFSTSLF